MHLAHYLGLLHKAQLDLAEAFVEVAEAHGDEPDVHVECERLASQCIAHAQQLQPFVARYGEDAVDEPERLHSELFQGTRSGPLGLLGDLHDLYLMASECDLSWTIVGQGAKGARDDDLIEVVNACEHETSIQQSWLLTRMKQAAPQALVVAP